MEKTGAHDIVVSIEDFKKSKRMSARVSLLSTLIISGLGCSQEGPTDEE